MSLSARRAWIEMTLHPSEFKPPVKVALRKESVDRNIILPLPILLPVSSLSARRAWIEISITNRQYNAEDVALRKESVDRNPFVLCIFRQK